MERNAAAGARQSIYASTDPYPPAIFGPASNTDWPAVLAGKECVEALIAESYHGEVEQAGTDWITLRWPNPWHVCLSCLAGPGEEINRARLARAMIQVIEFRGYIEQEAATDGYRLSDRLFSLGMQQPRTRNLIELALPVMRQLALAVGQSCHLALHSRGEIVVVARMESGEQSGYSVRVGHRRPLLKAASGAVLYAFQPDDVRARWEKLLEPEVTESELAAFRAHADAVRKRRVELTRSTIVAAVTDISAPVMRGGAAAAALTMPYIRKLQPSLSPRDTAVHVRAAADRISEQLVEGDSRV